MGNDGGSIPTRRELVKEAARNPTTTELKETQKEHLAHRWSTCPLSHKPLRRPVVSDCAGLLYNKDAVLQYLLPAEASSPLNKEDCDKLLQGRIKSLKDVIEVVFEAEAGQPGDKERWLCPVTSKELGPNVKAVYLVPCGHAFSQEAIKEMKTDQCLQCNQTYEPSNIITLFPATDDEKATLQLRIDGLTENGLTHSLKKAPGSSKKRKATKLAEEQNQHQELKENISQRNSSVSGSKPQQPSRSQSSTPAPLSRTTTPKPSSSITSGIKNAATASLTARVLEEENERKKRQKRRNGENENLKSLFTKKGDEKSKKLEDGNFMTRGFSISADARYE